MANDLILAGGLYVGDLILYLVLFTLLMWAVGHFAWGPINAMMQKRQDKVNGDIDHAQKARSDAEDNQKKIAAALADSKNQAVSIIAEAQKRGSAQEDAIMKQAHAAAAATQAAAEKDAAQARQDALAHAKDDIASLSVEIASKMINKELDASAHQQLINSYIKGLDDHGKA